MNVLLVTKPLVPPWNDSGKLVPRDLVLASSGRHHLHVLGCSGAGPEWPAFVTRHDLYPGAGGFRVGPLDRLRLLAGVWARRAEVDALHFFFQPHPAASDAARLLARACGRTAIHTVLSAPHERHAPRRVMFARLVVTLSSATARSLAPACPIPPRVIPPGLARLDPTPSARAETAAEGLPAGFVIYPGDYEFSGGHDLLLEAWSQAPDLPPLVFAGRDKTPAAAARRGELERRARILGLASRVRFLGTVPDMEALVAASAALLFPARSLYGKTDVPLVLLEAWRESRPVLASALPPLAELLEGVGPTLPDTPLAWADAVRRLAREGASAGARGRERLLDRYTARRAAAAYESLWDEIESGMKRTPPR